MANNMMNMQKMMKQAQKMQADMEKKSKDLEQQEFTGQDPTGLVQVKVNGAKKVLAIDLNPEVIDPEDPDMLSDLMLTAVNEALGKVDNKQADLFKGLGGGLPGF